MLAFPVLKHCSTVQLGTLESDHLGPSSDLLDRPAMVLSHKAYHNSPASMARDVIADMRSAENTESGATNAVAVNLNARDSSAPKIQLHGVEIEQRVELSSSIWCWLIQYLATRFTSTWHRSHPYPVVVGSQTSFLPRAHSVFAESHQGMTTRRTPCRKRSGWPLPPAYTLAIASRNEGPACLAHRDCRFEMNAWNTLQPAHSGRHVDCL